MPPLRYIMAWSLLVLTLGGSVALASPAFLKAIKSHMQKTHKGDQSPLRRIKDELSEMEPDWEQIDKDAKAIGDMAEFLDNANLGGLRRTVASYVNPAKALTKAVEQRQPGAALQAHSRLLQSCNNCHYPSVPR